MMVTLYKTMWMYLILLNLTLKNGQKSKFCYVHFTATEKKKLRGHENPGVREFIKEAMESPPEAKWRHDLVIEVWNCCMWVCDKLPWSRPILWDPWPVAHQSPLPLEFSLQEYWSGLPCSPPGDLPEPGITPSTPTSPALADRFFTTSATWEAFGSGNPTHPPIFVGRQHG